MATGKRRKPASDRKEGSIRIRVTDAQRRQFREAASRAGLDVSAWLRSIAVKAARDS